MHSYGDDIRRFFSLSFLVVFLFLALFILFAIRRERIYYVVDYKRMGTALSVISRVCFFRRVLNEMSSYYSVGD